MIVYLAKNLTNLLCDQRIIDKEAEEVYRYGFELIISSLVGIFLILLLGFLLSEPIGSLIFLVVFIWTRQYCGGYHANSYFTCNLTFVSLYLLVMLAYRLFNNCHFSIELILILLSAVTMLEYAPVVHPDKTLTPEEKKKCRYLSFILTGIWIALIMLLRFGGNPLSIFISLTLFCVSILMMIEKIIRKEVLI